jgi:hypothetical protein
MPAYKRINQNSNTSSNAYRTFNKIQNVEEFRRVNSIHSDESQQIPDIPQQIPQQIPPQQIQPQQIPNNPQQIPPQQIPQVEQFKHLHNQNLPSEALEIQEQVKQQQQEREEQINNIPKKEDLPNLEPRSKLIEKENFDKEHFRNEVKNEVRNEVKNEVKNELQEQVRKELQEQVRKELQEQVRKELREEIQSELSSEYGNEVNKMKQQLTSSFEEHQTNEKDKRENFNKNITIQDIQEKYNSSDNIDGYHLLEVNRILQSTPSLSFEQARSIANINGCNEDGSNSVCPSKKIEHFQEKGNCVGGKCKVSFSEPKKEENFENDNSLAGKVKDLQIQFYSNQRCGFCHKSKDLFSKEGVLEHINVLDNTPLPNGVEGYPHFVSKKTGKGHTGAPSSIESLINRLS